jgi:DNA-binding MarR family transcriptional regulator
MTDVISGPRSPVERLGKHPADQVDEPRIIALIELLFFAYRDFISDPDQILAAYRFGRAHHRVLHFVGRNPDIRVAELLDILRITKQSLGRVLKELIETGYVYQKEGARDRRQRLLHLTGKGEDLRLRLMLPQIERVRRALAEAGGGEAEQRYREMLTGLIDPGERAHVARLVRDRE